MKIPSLESRLASVDTSDVRSSLLAKLKKREYTKAVNLGNPYLKKDLLNNIITKLNYYAPVGEKFRSNLSSRLNKYEAKRVFYGLLCMGYPSGKEENMKQVMSKLTDWEKVYFFTGVWKDRTDAGMAQSVRELVGDYVRIGKKYLVETHAEKPFDYRRIRKKK